MYLNFDLLVPISNEDIENWGKNPKEFQCQDCGRQCKDQQSFENHKQFHKYYLRDSSVQKLCDKCDRNIPKRLFQRHLESVHQIAKSSVNILKEGIFLTLSEKGFTRTRQVWQNFCKISYPYQGAHSPHHITAWTPDFQTFILPCCSPPKTEVRTLFHKFFMANILFWEYLGVICFRPKNQSFL